MGDLQSKLTRSRLALLVENACQGKSIKKPTWLNTRRY